MYNKESCNFIEEIFLVSAYIVCIYGILFSFGGIANLDKSFQFSEIVNQTVLGIVVISSVLYYEITQNNSTLMSFIGFRRSNIRLYFIYSIVGFLLIVLFSSVMNFLSHAILPQMPTFFDNLGTTSVSKFYLVSIFVAPFSEEIFFRGFLQGILTKKFGLHKGIAFTVAVFSVLHTAYIPYSSAFLSIIFMGFVLSYVKHQTHSIIPCIVIHFLNNILAYTILFN